MGQPARGGSSLSTKQLARTAVDGKALTIRVDGENLRGYLCGMDDFHWMIVTPDGEKHLVHKGSASIITLADEPSYEAEENHDVLERVVGPFREAMIRDHFNRTPARAS